MRTIPGKFPSLTAKDLKKRSITELWAIKMVDSDCLKKLVERMMRRLLEVTEREGACTKY